jgi:hypothetical protein
MDTVGLHCASRNASRVPIAIAKPVAGQRFETTA